MTLARYEKTGLGPLNNRAEAGTLVPGTTYQTDDGAYLANTPYTFTAIGGGGEAVFVGPPSWVSGADYEIGQYVISQLSWHQYIRKTKGAGSADPANDKTNWQLVGAGGIKSKQSGLLAISGTAASASAVISTVVPAACIVNVAPFGVSTSGTPVTARSSYGLTATQLTISRSVTGSLSYFAWDITEHWS